VREKDRRQNLCHYAYDRFIYLFFHSSSAQTTARNQRENEANKQQPVCTAVPNTWQIEREILIKNWNLTNLETSPVSNQKVDVYISFVSDLWRRFLRPKTCSKRFFRFNFPFVYFLALSLLLRIDMMLSLHFSSIH